MSEGWGDTKNGAVGEDAGRTADGTADGAAGRIANGATSNAANSFAGKGWLAPPRRLTCTVATGFDGATVEQVLRGQLGLTHRTISRAKFVEQGITLNGERVRVRTVVRAGQRVGVIIGDSAMRARGSRVRPEGGPLSVAYEDDDVLVVDKPAGLAIHPGPGHRTGTLGNYVAGHLVSQGQVPLLHVVNRLDLGTSGLLVIAKNATAQHRLTCALHTSAFVRTYLAVCDGAPKPRESVVDAPILQPDPRSARRIISPAGKPAQTSYRVLATGELPEQIEGQQSGLQNASGAAVTHSAAVHSMTTISSADASRTPRTISLIELHLLTGRTHQIRLHMAHIGCGLLGDETYGVPVPQLSRPALHSSYLEFDHPITGRRIALSSPVPDDLQAVLYAAGI